MNRPALDDAAPQPAARNVLLLAHRIPFPPEKGDKIRSYHLLRHLAARHRVYLGAFVDDRADLAHEAALRRICANLRLFPIDRRARMAASLLGVFTGEPLSVRFYRDRRVREWIDGLRARCQLDAVVTCSSTMAQFAQGAGWSTTTRIADFVDVDSEKWRQYAAVAAAPMSWVYAREARTLLAFERHIAAGFTRTLFASDAEARLFARRAPEAIERVGHFSNGVDAGHFDPDVELPNPYPPGGPVLVFTGVMDYRPNIEAVTWFADDIFPLVLRHRPDARFCIVGSRPVRAVRRLGTRAGITVTGHVDDVRSYLKFAAVSVAPLRIARGIQNKVLEALAMARPVVCTRSAAEGIDPEGSVLAVVGDDARCFADAVVRAIDVGELGRARALVRDRFSWRGHLEAVDRLIDASHGTDASSRRPAGVEAKASTIG